MLRPVHLALGLVAVLLGGAAAGLVSAATDWRSAAAAFDAPFWRAVRFTVAQAVLSTAFSVLPAIVVAHALSVHDRFPGRAFILRLLAVPLALPPIVGALGLLALYGRGGVLAGTVADLGLGRWPGIYGFWGVIVAHVFFNLPIAARLLAHALAAIPPEQWRLAAQLGFGPLERFRLVEWPALARALPSAASLVLMLCIASFTLVLTLGGGPAATTVEVAIYQALRFDFDPARAVALTVAQLGLTALLLLALSRFSAPGLADASPLLAPHRRYGRSSLDASISALAILAVTVFIGAPLAAIAIQGLGADLPRLARDPSVLGATAVSLALAATAGVLAVGMAFALARSIPLGAPAVDRLTASFARSSAYLLVVPQVVIGAGWFILLLGRIDPAKAAPVMVVSVNALMALPFALRVAAPARHAADARHDRLCASLGIAGWARLRHVDWPVLRRPGFTALAFAMALSLGDLGVIALFGSETVRTLPFLLYERMGSYRTQDAAGLALWLGLLCLVLMTLADRNAAKASR